jgi:hypothetical protein
MCLAISSLNKEIVFGKLCPFGWFQFGLLVKTKLECGLIFDLVLENGN